MQNALACLKWVCQERKKGFLRKDQLSRRHYYDRDYATGVGKNTLAIVMNTCRPITVSGEFFIALPPCGRRTGECRLPEPEFKKKFGPRRCDPLLCRMARLKTQPRDAGKRMETVDDEFLDEAEVYRSKSKPISHSLRGFNTTRMPTSLVPDAYKGKTGAASTPMV